MSTIIAVLIIMAALTAAMRYIIMEKKKGTRCIGCSAGGCCSGCSDCSCGSNAEQHKKGQNTRPHQQNEKE